MLFRLSPLSVEVPLILTEVIFFVWPDENTLHCLGRAARGAVPTGAPYLVSSHGSLAMGWRGRGEQHHGRRAWPGFAHALRWRACAGQPQGRRTILDLK